MQTSIAVWWPILLTRHSDPKSIISFGKSAFSDILRIIFEHYILIITGVRPEDSER